MVLLKRQKPVSVEWNAIALIIVNSIYKCHLITLISMFEDVPILNEKENKKIKIKNKKGYINKIL